MTKAAAKRSMRHECEHRTGAGYERSDPLTHSEKNKLGIGWQSSAAPSAHRRDWGYRGQRPLAGF